MSLKIGQFNSDSINPQAALTTETMQVKSISRTSELTSGTKFYDKAIFLDGQFEADSYYYVQLAIAKFGLSNQDLTFQLASGQTADEEEETQFLGTMTNYAIQGGGYKRNFTNPKEITERYFSIIEMIISPNDNYKRLDIVLGRNLYDYIYQDGDDPGVDYSEQGLDGNSTGDLSQNLLNGSSNTSYKGRILTLDETNCAVYKINNLINGKVFNKIGIQGPPGLLCCINGEGIRVGPSGIYELKNSNYNINFIGIIPKISTDSSGKINYDRFIIDYQYDDNQQETNNG